MLVGDLNFLNIEWVTYRAECLDGVEFVFNLIFRGSCYKRGITDPSLGK